MFYRLKNPGLAIHPSKLEGGIYMVSKGSLEWKLTSNWT